MSEKYHDPRYKGNKSTYWWLGGLAVGALVVFGVLFWIRGNAASKPALSPRPNVAATPKATPPPVSAAQATPAPTPAITENDKKLADLRAQLLGTQDWEQIERLVAEIFALDSNDALAWSYRGRLHEKKGELDEAMAAYDRSVSSPSKTYYFYYLRARLQRQRGDLPGAIASLEAARELKTDSVILSNLILVYRIQDGQTEAVRSLVKTYEDSEVQSNRDQWLAAAAALALHDGDKNKAELHLQRFRNLVKPEIFRIVVADAFFTSYRERYPEVFSDPAQL